MTRPFSPRFVSFNSLDFFTRLYRQYCEDFDAVAPFYNVDYRTKDGRLRAAEAAASHPRDRAVLVDALRRQNERWGEDETVQRNIDALADPDSVAVVTGQQVGLFTGPAYTVYKTLTVLRLARQLADESGRKVVPVFWLEADDHDFAEIASVSVFAGNAPRQLQYPVPAAPENGNYGPVGRIALTEEIESVVSELDDALPPTEFKPDLMAAVRSSYRPGTTMLDAFARLMRSLFRGSGLVFISPDDAVLKSLASSLFEREVSDTYGVAERLHGVSEKLRDGYHAQVSVKPSNLFIINETGRLPLDAENGAFRPRGSNESFSRDDILAVLAEHPEKFSANVVLRPLLQDTLLPTAVYVAGPSEVAYFAQFKSVYEWAGIPMPAIFPRASVSIVETKVEKVLDEFDVTLGDLDEPLESLFQRLVQERMGSEVDAQFEAASRRLHEAIDGLKPVLEKVDRTLVKSSEATRAALIKELDRFSHRVLKAEKRNHEQVRAKLAKAQTNLFPGGKPQERSISMLYFLNKYGPDLIRDLQESLSLEAHAHQVISI